MVRNLMHKLLIIFLYAAIFVAICMFLPDAIGATNDVIRGN